MQEPTTAQGKAALAFLPAAPNAPKSLGATARPAHQPEMSAKMATCCLAAPGGSGAPSSDRMGLMCSCAQNTWPPFAWHSTSSWHARPAAMAAEMRFTVAASVPEPCRRQRSWRHG